MVVKRVNGFKVALGGLMLVWVFLFVAGVAGFFRADAGGTEQAIGQTVEQSAEQAVEQAAEAPTVFTQTLVNIVDAAGGDWIGASLALFIIGLSVIGLYRFLSWAGGKMKTPVGTQWANILQKILAVVLGSEAEWKNRVMAPGAPPGAEKAEKLKVLKKLSKDHPLVSKEIKGVVDEMFTRR